MNDVVTEQVYRVEPIWLLKDVFSRIWYLFLSLIFLFLYFLARGNVNLDFFWIIISLDLAGIVLLSPIYFTFSVLRVRNFHYEVTNKDLLIKQGVINKQQRNIPYGVIQNVLVKRTILDRVFGVCTLIIENAVQNNQDAKAMKFNKYKRSNIVVLGSVGNQVLIPGLTEFNAEKLKEILLNKMTANPVQDLGI